MRAREHRLPGEVDLVHATHRCLVRTPDRLEGRLVWVGPTVATVLTGGRHRRYPRHQLILLEEVDP